MTPLVRPFRCFAGRSLDIFHALAIVIHVLAIVIRALAIVIHALAIVTTVIFGMGRPPPVGRPGLDDRPTSHLDTRYCSLTVLTSTWTADIWRIGLGQDPDLSGMAAWSVAVSVKAILVGFGLA